MEGAHTGGRALKAGVVVGSKASAKEQRQRAQSGAAAAGRRGQATKLVRTSEKNQSKQGAAIAKEVARAMKQGSALVQAAVEHLETAERSWDRFVSQGGHVIDGWPTEVQVVTYMSTMSRERQRMCLAQRGKRRKGVQKNAVRNYVAEMANNLWETKYALFGQLEDSVKKKYWSTIFTAYKSMYAAAYSRTPSQGGRSGRLARPKLLL